MALFNPQLQEGNKEVHAFRKSFSSKANVIEELEFELAYNDAVVQHISHHTLTISTCFVVLYKITQLDYKYGLIDFNSISIPLGLFYAPMWGNRVN